MKNKRTVEVGYYDKSVRKANPNNKNNYLWFEMQYEGKLKHGYEKWYHQTGDLRNHFNFVKGERSGLSFSFFEWCSYFQTHRKGLEHGVQIDFINI